MENIKEHEKLKGLVKRYLPLAKGAVFCGVPISEMSREELITAVVIAVERELRG